MLAFLFKSRQDKNTYLLPKKVVPCLLICVFVFVPLEHSYSLLLVWVCVYVCVFSVGVGNYYSWYFQRNVGLSLRCSFVILLLVPFLLYIVFERPTTKSLQ